MEMQPSLGWGMVTVKEPAPVDGMKDCRCGRQQGLNDSGQVT